MKKYIKIISCFFICVLLIAMSIFSLAVPASATEGEGEEENKLDELLKYNWDLTDIPVDSCTTFITFTPNSITVLFVPTFCIETVDVGVNPHIFLTLFDGDFPYPVWTGSKQLTGSNNIKFEMKEVTKRNIFVHSSYFTYTDNVYVLDHVRAMGEKYGTNKGWQNIKYQKNLTDYLTNSVTPEFTEEGLLKAGAYKADLSCLDEYDYRTYYFKDNIPDICYGFSNKPSLTTTEYKEGKNDDAKIYSLDYVGHGLVYYNRWGLAITIDNWLKYIGAKKFAVDLVSDWSVEIDDSGNKNYKGARVVCSWVSDRGDDLDFLSEAFPSDKETLEQNDWRKGRPSDTNYPYCITFVNSGNEIFRIYMNSRPRIWAWRYSETKCDYGINMLSSYGYCYSTKNDMYLPFDMTVNAGKDYLQQAFYRYFAHEMNSFDDELRLHFWENYKNSTNGNGYVGTKVLFNWDISQDMVVGARDDDFDYSTIKDDNLGHFTDDNGNNHGGNLDGYPDEDKNNFNDNKGGNNGANDGKDDFNNSDFEFNNNGLWGYANQFLRFCHNAFQIVPSFIWTLLASSIVILIILRILGR